MPIASLDNPAFIDVLLIGGGASGLALAGELCAQGLAVAIVDAQGCRALEASFGVFEDELPQWARSAVAARWERVHFRSSHGDRAFPYPYVRLDSSRLHSLLRERADAARIIGARVERVEPAGQGFDVLLDDGRSLRARRVVETSGHRGAAHCQVALGATLRGAHDLREPLLMDFSGEASGTFLYALPMASDVLFVEETALITADMPSWSTLEERLRARLAALGLTGELDIHERCVIPMDPPLVDLDSAVLAFGAAAAMVHPATGYQLGASLALAKPFAQSIAATLARSPEEAAERCWQVLWPRDRQRVRELRLFGARLVADLDHAGQAAFFDAFFRLPPRVARTYLSHDASLRETCVAMFQLFSILPVHLRWQITRRGLTRPLPLLRPLIAA